MLAPERGSVQAVVSDMAMPVMGGRLLAERLMQSYPDVPVLLMSGYTDELVRKGMLASGTATLLPKPLAAWPCRAIGPSRG